MPLTKMAAQSHAPANEAVLWGGRTWRAEVTLPEVHPTALPPRGPRLLRRRLRLAAPWAMRLDPRLGGAAALRLLLAAHVVAAFEPITVGIAIGAASALTGYLSYKDLYCRFAECCRSERPLNASGTAGLPWRGSRGAGDRTPRASAPRHPALTLRSGRREERWSFGLGCSLGSRVFGEILRVAGGLPDFLRKVCIPWEDSKKKLKAAALLRRVNPVKYFSDVQRPPRKPSGPRFSSKPVGVAGGIAKQPSREGQSLDERTHLVSLLLQSVSLEVASCDRSPVVQPQCHPWGLAEIPCWTTMQTCASHFGQLGRALLFWCVFNVYFSLSFSGWLLQPSSRTWRRSYLGSIWPQR